MEYETYMYLGIAIIVILIVAIIVGTWHHINYGKFTPKFEEFSDGSVRMIFFDVSERCARQMERFNAEYKVGDGVEWKGRHFVIEEIKPQIFNNTLAAHPALVAYLKEQ
ncbi:hypothetical protein [Prevotella sp. kh1p2]|uniref:hypothetical protein n=1 Tax=Prevotella sp. kh1p2 TaxID=1761883 RepID=UPI0008BA35C7|nr:hypothetical protein [Prevotella sp. kh1p2]SES63393.1 hypothetical protein SAMN04487825_101112 [Prevotella sp. kh1p2]SNU10142.1 hypothetical protein SAMN06298210_101174 [Prevotellaceae bacterium KH2P17]